ncbi:ROK family protein [Weissella paramesenteroides]|jgi:predicted NBD/HSP70 family sugar kinase|uniref:ROK family protein n=1 Tax=Weissella paramesenteroides TaxID=1249 RepID=UPI002E7BD107|nr:ROK family protein [Weissella paramesenteroides]WPQ67632.1 ROK family protein [Weissella paramesenteroides]
MNEGTKKETFHQGNLRLVLQQVINNAPISRIEIARNLGMNKSSITTLYNEVDEMGYLKEIGSGEASKMGGRKPTLVTINDKYGYTVSVDLGYRHLHIMSNLLNGESIGYERIEINSRDILDIVDIINKQIQTIDADMDTENGLLGIAFSIHGVVYENKISKSPFWDVKDVDLKQIFEDKYQVPVILENEANLSAVYERDFNAAQNEKNILSVSIHKGIGAGIILDRNLYHGFKGAAGEIGSSLMFTDIDEQNQYNFDKVENYCSEDAIIDSIQRQKNITGLDREGLEKLLRDDDKDAQKVVDLFIAAISRVIYNASVSFSPEKIFINSKLMEDIPEIFTAIQTTTKSLDMVPELYLTKRSNYATLLGACSMITHHVLGLDDYNLVFSGNDNN